ncbi:flagellar hook-length control protein FliK [Clostridium sp. C105KSO13]|uniref:flagellar hook-length control protein FliK n=1 Tax=Clostridium sp. C105KSO13 TaxID=1776045 RepID=UPI00074087C6|nr:flagellar hook-length control protein FliK [Clostridium sp. C105KSO13]CUX49239.1 Flagellar hook-length control protein FliK [Clostridium sp. C105KSO13]
MNQITETLPRQEKKCHVLGKGKNKEKVQKSFEDILKGQKKAQTVFTGDGAIVCPQMQAMFFQTLPGKTVKIQNDLSKLSSVSQIQEGPLAGHPKEGQETVQDTTMENIAGKTEDSFNTIRPVIQMSQDNSTQAAQSTSLKGQTADSLGTISSVETAGKERPATAPERKSSMPKVTEERPAAAKETGNEMQAVQKFTVHTEYVHDAKAGREAALAPREKIQPDIQDLKSKIIDQMNTGKKEFQVQLKPDNLGTVLVKASYENGKAVISIVCMESKTVHTMAQNAEELGNLIQSRLGGPTQVMVEMPHTDYLEQQGKRQEGREQQDRGRQEKKENPANEGSEEFLQQLRLGLT